MDSKVDRFLKKKQVDIDRWDTIKKSFIIKYKDKYNYNGGDYDEYIINLWERWHTYVDLVIKENVVKGFADGKREKFIRNTSLEYVTVFEFAMPILENKRKVKDVIDGFYRLMKGELEIPNKKVAAIVAVENWSEFKSYTINWGG